MFSRRYILDKELRVFLQDNYPDLNHDMHIRFELGEPYKNGSAKRIKQASFRVSTLFENIFSMDDSIYLLIKDWECEDIMFGNTTPLYLYSLFNANNMNTETILVDDEDENGEKIFHSHKQHTIKLKVSEIYYQKILTGIGNYEQGREPSIGQSVYFINIEKNLIFHMYDDRGCLVSSSTPKNIKFLYEKFNEWIVNYHRKYIDSIFKNL